tara:strand:+ start:145 stop:1035 length:891 start_codon:yes stop_codon:yes gene_type:complete
MKCPTRFICHIHIPKTAGQAVQDALQEKWPDGKPPRQSIHDSLKVNPLSTAVIAKGHQYGSEIYTSYNRGKKRYIHDFRSRKYIAHLIHQGYTKLPWGTTPFGPNLKKITEAPEMICLSHGIKKEPAHWPGKITKKYWMEFMPDEMKLLGITEHRDIPIISVVRNPFSRLFSIYNFYCKQEHADYYDPELSFEEFILSFEDKYFRTDNMFGTCFDHLSIENQLLTTDILKFESLSSDFKAFCKKYDIPDRQLDRINDNPNKKGAPVYTKKMIKVVERLFEKDLNEFNYSYEQFIKK